MLKSFSDGKRVWYHTEKRCLSQYSRRDVVIRDGRLGLSFGLFSLISGPVCQNNINLVPIISIFTLPFTEIDLYHLTSSQPGSNKCNELIRSFTGDSVIPE